MRRLGTVVAAAAVVAAGALQVGSGAETTRVHFRVYAKTRIALTDVLWTGKRFLYVENTTSKVFSAGPGGKRVRPFAAMPENVEETRCRLSPGAHGFARGDVYCHSPDAKIYRLSPDGAVTLFATLPTSDRTDGALAFDTVGSFGYALLAATGRSGTTGAAGGAVYAIDARGRVRHVGDYPGPGGADEIAIAPRRFGTGGGKLLLTVDAGVAGSVQALDATGRASVLVTLSDGPNPIVVIPASSRSRRGLPPSGLYVADTASRSVYFASAAQLARFRGQVVVGSESKALFWVIRPLRGGFVAVPIGTDLTGPFNLEGATFIR